jgi:hypothetical protein
MKLIEKSSATYLRRMVKEINKSGRRVFHAGTPVAEAKFAKGYLLIRFVANARGGTVNPYSDWAHPTSVDEFYDEYGRNICASREA